MGSIDYGFVQLSTVSRIQAIPYEFASSMNFRLTRFQLIAAILLISGCPTLLYQELFAQNRTQVYDEADLTALSPAGWQAVCSLRRGLQQYSGWRGEGEQSSTVALRRLFRSPCLLLAEDFALYSYHRCLYLPRYINIATRTQKSSESYGKSQSYRNF